MKKFFLICAGVLILMNCAEAAPIIPSVNVEVGTAENPEQVASTLQVIAVLTLVTLAPGILMMTTSFVRIVVIIGFLRNALATQNVPPNQVIIALAMFLTFYIMAPYWSQANDNGLQPYLAGQITQEEAITNVLEPMREFMFRQTREADLALFVNLADAERPETQEDVSTFVLIPAFMISELKTAFQIGFMLYVPFIVIDMIVATTLMSMGMMMLPPVMISLPFKILLFVMIDGWHLLIRSIIVSFRWRGCAMSGDLVIQLGQEALMIVLIVSAPMLGLGLAVGLAVSVFQATTSIQEQTLAFIPKIIAVFVAILIFGPWMLRIMVEFFSGIFIGLPARIG